MRLHHHPGSSNARKAAMTAVALGAPVELVLCDIAKGEHKAPGYLAKNPNGRVPTLEDGEFVLWESHAIMIYLADATPGQTLYPTDARARAEVNRWLFWTSAHWDVAIGGLYFEHTLKGLFGIGETELTQVKRHEAAFRQLATVLDAHLEARTWLVGDAPTLADYASSAPLMYARAARLPLGEFPAIGAWLARVRELDAWKATDPKR